jgi:hypothetical protein
MLQIHRPRLVGQDLATRLFRGCRLFLESGGRRRPTAVQLRRFRCATPLHRSAQSAICNRRLSNRSPRRQAASAILDDVVERRLQDSTRVVGALSTPSAVEDCIEPSIGIWSAASSQQTHSARRSCEPLMVWRSIQRGGRLMRRCALPPATIPYTLHYEVVASAVTALAIAHQRRRPGWLLAATLNAWTASSIEPGYAVKNLRRRQSRSKRPGNTY